MIAVPPGRAGSSERARRSRRGSMARMIHVAAIVMLVAAVAVTGCAKKKRITDESTIGTGATGTEESLSESGSLGRYKRGLGPEEDGILKDVHFAYDSY